MIPKENLSRRSITSSITLLIPTVVAGELLICASMTPTGVSPYYAAGGLLGLTAVAGAGVVLRSRWLAIAGNRPLQRMRDNCSTLLSGKTWHFLTVCRRGTW